MGTLKISGKMKTIDLKQEQIDKIITFVRSMYSLNYVASTDDYEKLEQMLHKLANN